MTSKSKSKILALLVAGALAVSGLCLTACGGSDSSSSSSSSSTQASSSSSTSSTSSSSSSSAATTTEDETDLSYLEDYLDEAFMGVTEGGEGFYYAAADDESLAVVAVLDTESVESVSFVGPIEFNGSYVTVSDETSGLSLTFEVLDNGDGTLTLDLGDLGSAVVAQCEVSDVITALEAIDQYTTAVL